MTDLGPAWHAAANDLGIRVTIPFLLAGSQDHGALEFVALVHDFGSPSGTLVTTTDDDVEMLHAATKGYGYFLSAVNARVYRIYDRQLFIDTLDDWGYFGAGLPPGWYTGRPWTP